VVAAERLAMRNIREILRLHLLVGVKSSREIARAAKCGKTTVNEYLALLRKSGISSWDEVKDLDEAEVEQLLGVGALPAPSPPRHERPLPKWLTIHEELRSRSVTLTLLWAEYREENPGGYKYSQFAEHYRRFRGKLAVVMRQTHKPGEKGFVDFCDGIPLTDAVTGEKIRTQLFVGAMGASSYTFARATLSQELESWVDVNRKFFEFLGGVPAILVPDNLKSGVKRPDRYEAEVNPTYQEMAEHYDTCVIPARVRKPRDKAKAENAVLQAQRWILAVLRHHIFYTLAEMNAAIDEKLGKLNTKTMRGYGKSRAELFTMLDKPALKPLPAVPFEYAEWKKARLGIDYHLRYDDHFYSAPYQLIEKDLWCRATMRVIEIFFKGKRVASHLRSSNKWGKSTFDAHMPSHHRAYAEWTPGRILSWMKTVGPSAEQVAACMLEEKPHPELAYRSALGIISLSKKYGVDRTEKACQKALRIKSPSYMTLKTMLKNRMEEVDTGPPPALTEPEQLLLLAQENTRGESYYH
jgi:transposase